MVVRSRDHDDISVENSRERNLCDYWSLPDTTNRLQDPNMESDVAAFRFITLWHNLATEALQKVATNIPEKRIENKLHMSKNEYIPASQIVYEIPEYGQHWIADNIKVHEKTKPQRLTDDTVNKKFQQSCREDHEISLTGSYTELY